jgi:hypothetical protein
LEHPTATSLLPLGRSFESFLHIPDTPIGCTDVNFLLNKVKGDSTFSPKPKSPSGATAGGTPLKMVPFFRKKALLQKRQVRLDLEVWANRHGTQAAKGRRRVSQG